MGRFPAHGLVAINKQGIQGLQAGAELERFGQGSELINQLQQPVFAVDDTAVLPMPEFSIQAGSGHGGVVAVGELDQFSGAQRTAAEWIEAFDVVFEGQ